MSDAFRKDVLAGYPSPGCFGLFLLAVGTLPLAGRIEHTPAMESRRPVVAGIVLRPDGTRVQDAEVVATSVRWADLGFPSSGTSARSGRYGEFSIGVSDAGPFVVTASSDPPAPDAPGVASLPWSARVDGVPADTGDVVLVLDPGSRILGRASDDRGAPLREFRVVLVERVADEDDRASRRIHSLSIRSADGGFEIHGAPVGSWDAFLVAEGHTASVPARLDLPAELAPLVLVSPRAARLRGVVVDASGSPVAGAHVTARAPGERGTAFFDEREPRRTGSEPEEIAAEELCVTGEDGAFDLAGIRPGPTALRAVAPGHAAAVPRSLDLQPGSTVENLRLALRRGAAVHGFVRDSHGEPVAGIDVGVLLDGDSAWQTTGTDGAFRFEHVPPASIVLAAWEGWPAGNPDRLESNPIERTFAVYEGEDVEILLGGSMERVIHVTGILSRGVPVANAKVSFTFTESGAEDVVTTTDAAGAYALELPEPGEYWVVLHLPSDSLAERSVTIDDVERQVVDLELPDTLLRGSVVDALGRPVEAEIRLRRTDLESSAGGWSTVATDHSSTDGSFVFEGLEPGPWRMRVRRETEPGARNPLATHVSTLDLARESSIEGLVVRLERGGEIEGTVHDLDGRPIAGARVTARGEDGFDYDHENPAEERVATDIGGHYRIEGLAPGAWRVRAVTSDLASPESMVLLVERRSFATADLALARGAFLEVALEDAGGRALLHGPGAWTRVLDEEGRAWFDLEEETFGVAVRELGPLPPGRWTVRRGDGKVFPAIEIELAPGERKPVTLRAVD